MPTEWLRTSLTHLYGDAFDQLEEVLRACPDERWSTSVWVVRPDDRHVLPIVRGLGEEFPESERLHLYSAFWVVAFHVLFWADHYLAGGLGEPAPPAPFSADDQRPHSLPQREYTREELLGYLEHCRTKAAGVLATLDDDAFQRPARIGRPFGDLLLNNLLQMNEHATQLALILNREAGWSDPRWTPEDRWYRPCPDCPPATP